MLVFKLIFTIFGYKLAGLLNTNAFGGLVVGFVVGDQLDYYAYRALLRWQSRRKIVASAKAEFDEHFINNLFLMIGMLCGSDGAISKEEIRATDDLMSQVLKLSRKKKAKAKDAFRLARRSALTFGQCASNYYSLYRMHPQMLEKTIQMLLGIALADHYISEQEDKLIKQAAIIFGYSAEEYEQIKVNLIGAAPALPCISRSYGILGCKESDSVEAIKQAYRGLVIKFHPDKLAGKELPPEFIALADNKFKEIQGAYEAIRVNRGF